MKLAAAVLAFSMMGAPRAVALAVGASAGPVPLTTLDGYAFEMTNYGERRATVVVFLSARSTPVREQMARLNAMRSTYHHRGVLFVGIGANPEERSAELRRFAHHHGCCFPIYRDPEGRAAALFGARAVPEAFLLDTEGVLRWRGPIGGDRGQGVEAAVEALLDGDPVPAPETVAQGTPVGEAGAPYRGEDPYGVLSFASELIFERAPNAAAHHCSALAEAANGDLLCLWYGGSYESAEDEVLFLARRPWGLRAWTDPEAVVRNDGQPPGNAVIFRDTRDRIWIVWGRMEATRPLRRGGGWGQCRLMYRISEDHGYTWSDDREFPEAYGALPRNAPVIRRDGTLLLPLTCHQPGRHGSYFLMTRDHGATWTPSAVAPGGSQPTVIERDDGSLFVMMRRRPKITQNVSHDGGRSWGETTASALRNPDAGVAMRKLANGHVVIVFNDTSIARTPLCIARSLDDGRTWEKPLALESNPGEYSYPCVIQTADGLIHVTYTCRRYAIKHVQFNERWLTDFERPN